MDGAEQILTELNSLHASFDNTNPNVINMEELLQANIPQTMGATTGGTGTVKQPPMYPFINQAIPTSNGPAWVTDDMANTAKAATALATSSSAPMLNIGTSNSNNPMEISLPSGNEVVSQNANMPVSDYQNDGQVMQMHQVDVSNEPMQVMIPPPKEVASTKRNTMSNWASSLSWTKAPRVLVVEDDAVS